MAQSSTQHPSEIPPGAFVELNVSEEETHNTSGKSLADAIQKIGMVENLPSDLSTNPQYMAGFGKTKI